jgi:uncharacterized protein YegL
LIADLLIDGPEVAPLMPIKDTDIRVTQNGRRLERVMPVAYNDPRRLAIAILFDSSVSMQGLPLLEARRGLQEFLAALPANSQYWLAHFSDATTPLVDWSTDPRQGIDACKAIEAEGHTALLEAVKKALDALASRTGDERILVIFSDGANTKPGPQPSELIVAARREEVRIYSLALQSGQVDEQTLDRLANETGGQSIVVRQASQLAYEFRELGHQLSMPCVRVVTLDYDPAQPCEMMLGAQPAKCLVIPPQFPPQTGGKGS